MRTSQGLISIAAIVACSSLGSLASASCPSSTPYGCVESYASYVYPWPGGKTYCRRWKPGSFKLVGIHGAPSVGGTWAGTQRTARARRDRPPR